MVTMLWLLFGLTIITITGYISITSEDSTGEVLEVYKEDGINHEVVESLYDSLHEAEVAENECNVDAIRHAIMLEETGYKITSDDIH